MIYLASPYSHPDKLILEARYLEAVRCTAMVLNAGYVAYSPIVHNHVVAKLHGLPQGFEFWQKFNTIMIGQSTRICVLQMSGWKESHGVKDICDLAFTLDKPIHFVDPFQMSEFITLLSTF